jgi:ketosteroid isomerase-like protein
MSREHPKATALRFNQAINGRDLESLVALMTHDHAFVDSESNCMQGRDAMQAAWSEFFAAFPDYRNVFTMVIVRGDTVLMLGRSECSDLALAGPAMWTARIRGDKVAEWRVRHDTPEARRLLEIDQV